VNVYSAGQVVAATLAAGAIGFLGGVAIGLSTRAAARLGAVSACVALVLAVALLT